MASPSTAPRTWADTSALAELYRAAAERAGHMERDYAIAGHRARVAAAGGALIDRMAPALAHLALETSAVPELEVHVWDSASTGTPEPELPVVEAGNAAPNARYYFEDGSTRAAYQPSGNMLSVYDEASRTAWYWLRDASALPFLDTAEPLRLLLHWWLGHRDVLMLHGGAVGTPGGGILITGKNGSGKSTATLASVVAPLGYAGDDYVAVRLEPHPVLYSLYNSGKLERDHARRLPHLAEGLIPDFRGAEKSVVYVADVFPERVATEFPLRAVVVPRITGRRRARLLPASPTEALAALAPTTLLQLHPPQPDALARMARLVRTVPTLRLELGSEIESIPQAILGYLEDGRT